MLASSLANPRTHIQQSPKAANTRLMNRDCWRTCLWQETPKIASAPGKMIKSVFIVPIKVNNIIEAVHGICVGGLRHPSRAQHHVCFLFICSVPLIRSANIVPTIDMNVGSRRAPYTFEEFDLFCFVALSVQSNCNKQLAKFYKLPLSIGHAAPAAKYIAGIGRGERQHSFPVASLICPVVTIQWHISCEQFTFGHWLVWEGSLLLLRTKALWHENSFKSTLIGHITNHGDNRSDSSERWFDNSAISSFAISYSIRRRCVLSVPRECGRRAFHWICI